MSKIKIILLTLVIITINVEFVMIVKAILTTDNLLIKSVAVELILFKVALYILINLILYVVWQIKENK